VSKARRLARFNRVVTNRIQGLWAGRIPPWVVVIHRGRTSGRIYRTPVLGSVHGSRLVIGLPYGEDADWVRNVVAAGGGTVMRSGRERTLRQVRVVDRGDRREVPSRATWFITPSRKVLVGDLDAPSP
jgi:deazaflavin-dependent oxidoreductase (nitroreductase family)